MAAPAFVISGGSSSASFASSITTTLDVGTGSDRTIIVEVASVGGASGSVVNSITVGGVALTLSGDESLLTQMGSAGRFRGGVLQGASIPEGSQAVVATMSDGLSKLTMIVTVYSGTTAVSSATLRPGSISFTPTVSASAAAHEIVAWLSLTSAIIGAGSIAATSPSSLRRDEISGGTAWQRMVSVDRVGVGGATAAGYTVTGGATPGHSGHYWVITGTSGDTTPPTLTSPSGTGGTLACSGSVSTNESGGTLYAVVTASATAPSAAQVKAGQDHAGASALRVVSQAVSATGTQTISSGSVTAGTRYWHYMHEDGAANQSTVASSASFSVSSGADTTPPVLSSPTGSATGTTTASVGATTDEGNGTLYVVVTTSATQPSVAQIKAGQTHTGSAAPYGSSQAVSSTGAKTFSATGLTAATTYYAHLVHADAAANDSNRVTSASFTTSAGTVYGFDFDTATGLTFGDLAGALTSLTRQTSVAMVARAYSTSTGALVATSGALTTDSNGRLPRWTDAALANATAYVVTFTRASDGEVCAARLTTT
jgi:hypothetical protein